MAIEPEKLFTAEEQVKSNNEHFGCGMMAGLFISFFVGALFMTPVLATLLSLRKEAIEHNFAEYNSQNGAWQWKEPAERETPKP